MDGIECVSGILVFGELNLLSLLLLYEYEILLGLLDKANDYPFWIDSLHVQPLIDFI